MSQVKTEYIYGRYSVGGSISGLSEGIVHNDFEVLEIFKITWVQKLCFGILIRCAISMISRVAKGTYIVLLRFCLFEVRNIVNPKE